METIVKINEIRLTKLDNPEYNNLMTHMLNAAKIATAEKLGVTDEDFAALETNINKMKDLIAQSQISEETAFLTKIDKYRDDLLVYLMAEINNKRKSPIENIKEDALPLYNTTKLYVGSQKAADQKETQLIKGLIFDLKKPENAYRVTALGLDEIVSQLDFRNTQYEEFTESRTESQAEHKIDNSKTVRAENDPLYDYITTKAFITSVATPSEEASKFITKLNATIEETETRYNQRKAAAKAHKKPEQKKPTEENKA